jgi:hypothetical protein
MKKCLLLSLALVLLGTYSFAQETIVYDFEDGQMPAEFTLINQDGLMPNQPDDIGFLDTAWMVIESGLLESFAALSISWYVDDAGPADDWMILPKFELGAGASLSWTAQSTTSSGNFPDSYQVLINTGEPTYDDFGNNGQIIAEYAPEEFETAQSRSVDLSDYAGQAVHIAFRNITPSGDALLIDDITLTEVITTSTVEVDQQAFDIAIAPNPAVAGSTLLSYTLENSSQVVIKVSSIDGKMIAQYPQGKLPAGQHQLWVPTDALTAGTYLVSIQDERKIGTIKLNVQ